MTASYLAALNAGVNITDAASRLVNSGTRMKALLDDLIDFNRTKLGLGLNIVPTNVDLAKLFADELNQLRAAHPDQRVDLELVGDTRGIWDGPRLQQLLGNLVLNAFKYGARDVPVQVAVTGDEAEVRFEVKNREPAIEASTLAQIFDPLKRGREQESQANPDGSLGLGLYIAREIAKSHGGEIEAGSDERETVFAVRHPRHGQLAS